MTATLPLRKSPDRISWGRPPRRSRARTPSAASKSGCASSVREWWIARTQFLQACPPRCSKPRSFPLKDLVLSDAKMDAVAPTYDLNCGESPSSALFFGGRGSALKHTSELVLK
jgi:hypothetical protein